MPQTTPQQPDLAERRGQKAWDGRSTPAICRTSPPPPTLQAYETSPSYTARLGRTGEAVAADGEVPQAEHALIAYQEGDAAPIAERFVEAALFASSSGRQLVDDVYAETESARERLTGLRKNASAWSVLPHLVAHPVLDAYAQQLHRQ